MEQNQISKDQQIAELKKQNVKLKRSNVILTICAVIWIIIMVYDHIIT